MPSTRTCCEDCPLTDIDVPYSEVELDEVHLITARLVSHFAGLRDAPTTINAEHANKAKMCAQKILGDKCSLWALEASSKRPSSGSFILKSKNK